MGGIATGLVAYPFGEVRRVFRIIWKALISHEASVRQLIEQNGGTIHVDTSDQDGARFVIRLPHRPVDEAMEGSA